MSVILQASPGQLFAEYWEGTALESQMVASQVWRFEVECWVRIVIEADQLTIPGSKVRGLCRWEYVDANQTYSFIARMHSFRSFGQGGMLELRGIRDFTQTDSPLDLARPVQPLFPVNPWMVGWESEESTPVADIMANLAAMQRKVVGETGPDRSDWYVGVDRATEQPRPRKKKAKSSLLIVKSRRAISLD